MPRHENFALNDGAQGEDGDVSRQNALEAIVSMRCRQGARRRGTHGELRSAQRNAGTRRNAAECGGLYQLRQRRSGTAMA